MLAMARPTSSLALALLLSGFWLSAVAGPADDDLRRAAKLHKGGDTAQAVAIWKSWAAGNADAAYNLAVTHQYGDGVALDPAEAMRWYRVAAEQGDKVSQFQIGLMYQTGQGVPADAAEAHRWFTMHRHHHLHHAHDPKMVAWRQQARALIEEGERREQLAASRRDADRVVTELRQRAGLDAQRPLAVAGTPQATALR
jgi:TPR repeat protein